MAKLQGLDDTGFVYVPNQCSGKSGCKLHVAFHGCSQSRTFMGRDYAQDTGYLEWAGTNGIIVLFPQAKPVTVKANPNGCWDFWGYGYKSDYLSKDGVQTAAVKAMIDRITSDPQ